MSLADFPLYSGETGKTGVCLYDPAKGVTQMASYTAVGTTSQDLQAAIYQQPVAVRIEVDTVYFQTYHNGILTNPNFCGSTPDQDALAVGYGVDPTYGDYYIVKNSWGPYWGKNGFIEIGITDYPGICGINTAATYPTP